MDERGAVVPCHARGQLGDIVAVAARDGDEGGQPEAQLRQVGADVVRDGREGRLREIDHVHLGNGDDDLLEAEEVEQIAVASGLLADPFGRVDDEDARIAAGGSGDHVAQELTVPGRIDQEIAARGRAELDVAHVDGDALVAFGLERVGHEGPFEGQVAAAGEGAELVQPGLREGAGLMEHAADQG